MKTLIAFSFSLAFLPLVAELPPPTLEKLGMRCWHDVAYGPRGDLADEGDGYEDQPDWVGKDIPWKAHRHRSGQFLDVFAPTNKVAADATVVLFLHGGSWSEKYDKDSPPLGIFGEVLAAGGIGCTADYILQSDRTRHFFASARKESTFAAMMRDIDAAVAKVKEFVGELGATSPRLVMMGESAGGHLALLYSYDQGNPTHTGLGLAHSLRVAKVVNIVGPTDLTAKEFRSLGKVTIFGFQIGPDFLGTLMNRLGGLEDNASNDKSLEAAAKWSPIKLVCAQSVPTAIAYGAVGKDEKTDGVVPVSQMTSLEAALKDAGVPCVSKKFSGLNHCEVTWRGEKWIAEQALAR